MKKRDMRPELFIPPVGFVRALPESKAEKYRIKLNEIGSFTRHEYDLDICTLYRQMDDLKGSYQYYGTHKYSDYVEQIRANAAIELRRLHKDIDADFYLDHFYCVLGPDDPSYMSFLALFLSMSDPLLIIPKLEYHLKEFKKHDPLGRGSEAFLGQLEFSICNTIRAARFPQDYFAKHDKIINWVYTKRDFVKYEHELNSKLDAVIDGINRISFSQKISKAVIRSSPGRKPTPEHTVSVKKEMISVLIRDLKERFSKNSIAPFREILKGKAKPSLMVNFNGQANQLIDVFRIYHDADFITPKDKRAIGKWVCAHFMYWDLKRSGYVPFDSVAAESIIYRNNPIAKANRILLSKLPKSQDLYYSKSKKSSSDTYSDK